MNLFKRALVNIGANKGKTLLLFVIFFTSMFAITMNNIVNVTYDKLLAEAFPNGDVPVYVQPQFPKSTFGQMTYNWEDQKEITREMYEEMEKSDLVSRMEKEMNVYVYNTSFEPIEGAYDNSMQIDFAEDPKALRGQDGFEYDYDQTLYSTGERPIILNDEFLEVNNLAIGDTIPIDFSDNIYSEDGNMMVVDELKEVVYTIVGSYHFEATQEMIDQEKKWAEEYEYEFNPDATFAYQKSRAFMPLKNGEELIKLAEENGANPSHLVYTYYTIYLKELSNLSAFKTEARKIAGFDVDVDVNFYSPESTTDFSALESILSARYTIESVFTMLLLVVFTMLIIIAILFVRGRRKEIGILVALGERRKNIYFQIVFEQIIVMIIATLVAFPSAMLVIRKLANTYAEVQLPFVISPLFFSLLAGLIVVLVSTLIPAIYTMRVNPKKILL